MKNILFVFVLLLSVGCAPDVPNPESGEEGGVIIKPAGEDDWEEGDSMTIVPGDPVEEE